MHWLPPQLAVPFVPTAQPGGEQAMLNANIRQCYKSQVHMALAVTVRKQTGGLCTSRQQTAGERVEGTAMHNPPVSLYVTAHLPT